MKRVKSLFLNFLVLTATALILQSISLAFRAYLAQTLGSEGLGLFQLTISIYFLAVTFATSGVRFTATRLVAEELGAGRQAGALKAVHACLLYAAAFGLVSMTLLNLGAGWIGTAWLNDARTVLSLRLFAFSLPLVSVSSVLSGYFIAVRRASNTAASQLFEQLIEVGTGVLFLRLFLPLGLEYACAAVVLGSDLGEIASCLLQFILYRADRRRHRTDDGKPVPALTRRLFRIAAPVACSAYLSAGIRTVEQLLIPYGLKKNGATANVALSSFGEIQGMAMPLIMFPALLLGTALELILPELAECRTGGCPRRLNYIIGRVFRIGILFSVCVMWIFLRFSGDLGAFVYHNEDASHLIRLLAALTPFLYLDLIVDMILKGLGEQMSTMRYNLFTSSINVVLLYLLLPKYAIAGYLVTIYFTRILNFLMSLNRLVSVTELSVGLSGIFRSVLCIIAATGFTDLLAGQLPSSPDPVSVFSQILMIVFFYLFFLRTLSLITHEDIEWGKSLLK